MKIILLGMIGPWQLALGGLVLLIPVLIIVLVVKNAKNKTKAQTLDSVMKNQKPDNSIERLERLTKLKESGALTEEEFQIEKKKII